MVENPAGIQNLAQPSGPSAGPNFEAEYQDALLRYQPILRQQQAYDSMRGWGQENAVMGPGYQQAGFGQITGDPTGGMGASPMSGINANQSGVYTPSGGSAGVYGAPKRPTVYR
jgi:hypothetical protein